MRSCPFTVLLAIATFALHFGGVTGAFAQGSAITYQGALQSSGLPANGVYNFKFTLYTNSTGGSPVTDPVIDSTIGVTNGVFTTPVDFGPGAFNNLPCWLEIAVATNNSSTFTTLSPRQHLTPAPYAIIAENVNAASLTNLNVSTALGTLPLASLPSPVVTNGSAGVSLANITSTNYYYVAKWLTNGYAISTNDTVLFCWGTNELLTLPAAAPFSKTFTVFSKNPNGSVILTNATGSQSITIPGVGQGLAVYLGGSISPSNLVTVMFDGSNY